MLALKAMVPLGLLYTAIIVLPLHDAHPTYYYSRRNMVVEAVGPVDVVTQVDMNGKNTALTLRNTVVASPQKIFVMGMPKSGTTSIMKFFRCGQRKTSHWLCANRKACGNCIYDNMQKNRDPIHNCGDFDVYAQMDRDGGDGKLCFFPQIDALDALHAYHPDATFILNLRPPDHWLKSVDSWKHLRKRLIDCNISTLPKGVGGHDDEMLHWYTSHADMIRTFVKQHPSHRLVEVQIEDEDAGVTMEKAFGIPRTCWGHSNKNKRITKSEPP